MAVRTSSQNGNWSASSTWGGSAAPGSGDKAIVNHVVTVDVATTVGESATGIPTVAPVLAKTTGGSLPTATYTVRYTTVTSGGAESSASAAVTITTDATNNRIQVTLPALPAGVASYKIYAQNSASVLLQLSGLTTAGPHNIDSIAGGAAYADNYAIRVGTSAGRLIVNADLTIKGDLALEGNTTASSVSLTQAAGVTIQFDGSGATYGYTVTSSLTNGNSSMAWKANGVLGNICTFQTVGGNANAVFQLLQRTQSGDLDLAYTTVKNIGTSARDCWTVAADASSRVLLDHVIFDGCGQFSTASALTAGAKFSLTNCTWKNSLSTRNVNMVTGGASLSGGGIRLIQHCVFDKIVRFNPLSMTWDGQVCMQMPGTPGSARTPAAMTNSLFRSITNSSAYRIGDWDECVMVIDASTYNNAGGYSAKADMSNGHWTTPETGPGGTYRVDRTIFESFGSDGVGDVDYGPNTLNFNSVFEYCIGVPEDRDSGNEYGPGTLTTLNGWSGAACKYNHNTWYLGGQGAIALAEGGNGYANMCDELQSNLFWNRNRGAESSTTFNRITYCPVKINNFTGLTEGQVNESKVGYNCRYNLYTGGGTETLGGAYTDGGRLGGSYHHYDTSGVSFTANDKTANPQFVDDTRRFWTWVRDVLCSGVHPLTGSPDRKDWQAYGLYLLCLMNEPNHADYKAAATIANYKAYIRAGFAPQNAVLQNAGHDGITIGAVELAAPAVKVSLWAWNTFTQPLDHEGH